LLTDLTSLVYILSQPKLAVLLGRAHSEAPQPDHLPRAPRSRSLRTLDAETTNKD